MKLGSWVRCKNPTDSSRFYKEGAEGVVVYFDPSSAQIGVRFYCGMFRTVEAGKAPQWFGEKEQFEEITGPTEEMPPVLLHTTLEVKELKPYTAITHGGHKEVRTVEVHVNGVMLETLKSGYPIGADTFDKVVRARAKVYEKALGTKAIFVKEYER